MTRLEATKNPVELNQPGYHFHQLTGDLKGFFAVKVSGNYRIIFRFENEMLLMLII
ncbi:type II toxin-antitoxin system RelE/ParE family toxin [Dyadobacter pollutisoli]|uniref:Type II toxin-antitoxin system RelE/ParE family toxin n=1 Tax=Dyadobacter pollutisoli TaxID=2910158 RepID=A0A9E8SPK5_9BACT|nr:type II toxin-antitoxin system RelE/ParE family toxin [Dyadobacter pollutisoli]